jgi:hypothetical protein
MLAYKKYITIEDPNRVVLLDLPFRAGQRVEVVVIAEDEARSVRLQELRTTVQGHPGTTSSSSRQRRRYCSGNCSLSCGAMKILIDTNVLVSAALKDKDPETVQQR